MRQKRNGQSGFTLMELMVVIVIVAILAAVAVPLYINYVKDAQRTEAKGAIGAIIAAEQVYYQSPNMGAGKYLDTAANAGEIEAGLKVDLTESKVNWDFKIDQTGGGDVDGFEVLASGKLTSNNTLGVIYKHSRTNGGVWSDTTLTAQ